MRTTRAVRDELEERRKLWDRLRAEGGRCDRRLPLADPDWVIGVFRAGFLGSVPLSPCSATSFLFAVEPAVRTAVDAFLETAFEVETEAHIDRLEGRSGWWWGHEEPWTRLRPEDVVQFRKTFPGGVAVLGLVSLHSNGYVRETAVRELAGLEDGRELRFLLRRLNDWVRPVREEAEKAVRERIQDRFVPRWLEMLGEIIPLLNVRRVDHSALVQDVLQLLVSPRHALALNEALPRLSCAARTELFRRAFRFDRDRIGWLIERGLELEGPAVQFLAARKAIEVATAAEQAELLARLSQSRSMPVRRVSLLAEVQSDPGRSGSIWRHALLDRHRSIRELAQASLRAAGFTDMAEDYRVALGRDPEALPALLGLGETGSESDVERLTAALTSPLASRRAAAIAGIGRCLPAERVDLFLESLHDTSPRVVREARKQLAARLDQFHEGGRYGVRALLDVIDRTTNSATIRAAMELIGMLGKWRSLPTLLSLWNSPVEGVAAASRDVAEKWFTPPRCHRNFTSPSPRESAEIRTIAERLPPSDREHIRLWLPFPLEGP